MSCGAQNSKKGVTAADVQDYYGKRLQDSDDLQTSACVLAKSAKMPKHVRDALALVHPEVSKKFYGCGLIAPEGLDGCRILDLGSGSGQDCFALARLVGPQGHVTGIDMTDEQLDVANKYIEYHKETFVYSKANTNFVKGFIEDLKTPGLQDNSFDIVVSNCVVNLSLDKKSVFEEAYRVLKDGGELYFSDMYTDSHLSDDIRKNKTLWGEGLAGALYWKDLHDLALEIGFTVPRIVSANEMSIVKPEVKTLVGGARYVAVTYRLFKIAPSGKKTKMATYKGSLIDKENEFEFDKYNVFKKNEAKLIDSELGGIFATSRFSQHFDLNDTDDATVNQNEGVNPFDVMKPYSSGGCCGNNA